MEKGAAMAHPSPPCMSLAEDLASVRWRVTMLVATLVEMHCDVTQRRCSPNHGRFKELEQMHGEIARDVEGHKARCSVSAVAAFAKAREAATPAARQAHMARLAVLEKDAADAAQGLTTLWAFADRISSIGHRISSRQTALKTYEKQWHHEVLIKKITSIEPDSAQRLLAIEQARERRADDMSRNRHHHDNLFNLRQDLSKSKASLRRSHAGPSSAQVQSMMKAKEADVSLQAATKASFASPFSPGVGLRPTAVLAKSSLNKRYYAGGR